MTTMKYSQIMTEEAMKDIDLENYKLIENIFNFDKDEEEKKENEDDYDEREKKMDEFKKKEIDMVKKIIWRFILCIKD